MSDCKRQGKWRGGCNFQPRYDLSAANPPKFTADRMTDDTLSIVFDSCRTKTYVRDVCETCGKTIERSGNHGGNTAS